jgi:hypothetical protein
MAVLGSLIIDQIIFKDDIEKAKLDSNEILVRKLMTPRSAELRNQIAQLNLSIDRKQTERKGMVDDISKNPITKIVETSEGQAPVTRTIKDSTNTVTTETTLKKTMVRNIRSTPNPNIALLDPLDKQLYELNTNKTAKENSLLTLQDQLKKEVDKNVGFIDELKIMIDLLKGSIIATAVYIIWLIFLLLLELLILIGKSYDSESDYDRTIQKQMSIHLRKIELL